MNDTPMIRLSTWNVCLGLKNKKDYVYNETKQNEIDICLLQEVEIETGFNEELLTAKDYVIEVENNAKKSRTAIILKDNIDYIRRRDLELCDYGIVIIDVNVSKKYRVINVYRSFNPPNGVTPLAFFERQLQIINQALANLNGREIIISGDFNLDDSKRYATDYRNKHYFEKMSEIFDELDLIQLIDQPTWHRTVNNVTKSSILDHIYVRNPHVISNIVMSTPLVGDHKLVKFELSGSRPLPKQIIRRNWSLYTKEKLLVELASEPFNIETDSVQDTWNLFENALINITDKLAPLSTVKSTFNTKSNQNAHIKRKLNLRRKLLNKLRLNPSNVIRDRVKHLNIEIKQHFAEQKSFFVRKKIIPGNSKTLWEAVKIAKDIHTPKLPPKMSLENIEIQNIDLPDVFAQFFENKVNKIVNDQQISDSVYNGKRKIWTVDHHFMSIDNILEAVKSLKSKISEGYDRIPQRILVEGIEILKYPLSYLFNQIYETKKIPEQWLISKVIPIHKKGNKTKIENYRPISNLCSTSKIFEKLILKRIQKIELLKGVDLTGKPQHGFKAKHSTGTACINIQSVIARALDGDDYALMSTLDLSSAFDVVNVELLLRRLKILGLPGDIISLISEWLTNRYFYVGIDGENSYIRHCGVGTVQGSILGPILYALFVSPLFDLEKMTLFADDNYVIVRNKHLPELLLEMKRTLEAITKWLVQSGLKVNDEKTEICLFSRKDTPPVKISLNGTVLTSKTHMKVLGVHFDTKLNWQLQTQMAITKAKKALQAIKLIRKHFTKNELRTLIISNYYSTLYYNSEVWLIPSLTNQTKRMLISASASPLKLCCPSYHRFISFEHLHQITKRPTPSSLTKYNHALLLHKTYNAPLGDPNRIDINFNQNFNQRSLTANFYDTSHFKQGKNLVCNRLTVINNTIPLDWLNLPFHLFKIKAKRIFLPPT